MYFWQQGAGEPELDYDPSEGQPRRSATSEASISSLSGSEGRRSANPAPSDSRARTPDPSVIVAPVPAAHSQLAAAQPSQPRAFRIRGGKRVRRQKAKQAAAAAATPPPRKAAAGGKGTELGGAKWVRIPKRPATTADRPASKKQRRASDKPAPGTATSSQRATAQAATGGGKQQAGGGKQVAQRQVAVYTSGPRVTCRWLGGGEGGHNQPRKPHISEYRQAPYISQRSAEQCVRIATATAEHNTQLQKLLGEKDQQLRAKQEYINSLQYRLEQQSSARRHWKAETERLAIRNKDFQEENSRLYSELSRADASKLPSSDEALADAFARGDTQFE